MAEKKKSPVKIVLAILSGLVLIACGILLIWAGLRPDDRDGRIVYAGGFFIILGLASLAYLLPPIPIRDKKEKLRRKAPDPQILLDAYENGQLDHAAFMKAFGKAFVYYSTPYGDDEEGNPKLFLVTDAGGQVYLPVFTTLEKAAAYHRQERRAAFMIMNDPCLKVLQTTIAINRGTAPTPLGLIVDPPESPLAIAAGELEAVGMQMEEHTQ